MILHMSKPRSERELCRPVCEAKTMGGEIHRFTDFPEKVNCVECLRIMAKVEPPPEPGKGETLKGSRILKSDTRTIYRVSEPSKEGG